MGGRQEALAEDSQNEKKYGNTRRPGAPRRAVVETEALRRGDRRRAPAGREWGVGRRGLGNRAGGQGLMERPVMGLAA